MKIRVEDGCFAPERVAYNFIDMTGLEFGHLTVIRRVQDKVYSSGRRKPQWLCKCDCGKYTLVTSDCLRSGYAKSCGCHQNDGLIKCSTKHGKRYERIYSIFCDMKKRCYNKKSMGYKHYGGKGIRICDEWLNDFTSFYDWAMSNGYEETLTIDRIDSAGNYEPSNCRWITRSENISRRNVEYWRKYRENKVR